LYWMGDFDSDTGIFETRVPEQTVTGKQVKIRS
jgi:hypothetical protein